MFSTDQIIIINATHFLVDCYTCYMRCASLPVAVLLAQSKVTPLCSKITLISINATWIFLIKRPTQWHSCIQLICINTIMALVCLVSLNKIKRGSGYNRYIVSHTLLLNKINTYNTPARLRLYRMFRILRGTAGILSTTPSC